MDWLIIILLIVLGLVALILELLVIPGGIVGILGVLTMAGGVVFTYINHGNTAGNIVLICTLAFTVIMVILMLRSKTWRKLMLHTNIDGKVNEINESKIQTGMDGIAVSRLAPAGKGKFGDEVVEVHSLHEFIDVNTEIQIVKIEGNKIIVKQKID